MTTLLLVCASSVVLAQLSQWYGGGIRERGNKPRWDLFVLAIVVILSLFAGLRTDYNDTAAYIRGFQSAETIGAFLSDSENLHVLHNPLFYGLTALIRTVTDNYHIYLLIFAAVNEVLLIRFVQRYTADGNFAFGLWLFFGIGAYVFSMAAMKHITAMAVLTLAVPALNERKWAKYYIIVALAGLLHTYAFLFVFLPLLTGKPWGGRILLVALATVTVMLTFEDSIGTLLSYADSMGKHVAEFEVFDGNQMNPLRVAVFAVVPAMSLIFRRRLFPAMGRQEAVLINMSIVSLMFMLMATVNGANMFGRLATYFELGAACSLPWMIDQIFERRSARLVKLCATVCFLVFFLYDNWGFTYHGVSFFAFIAGLV